MARVWYCANCGYEIGSRGRCHACREKLTPSHLPELAPGGDEVGYRIDGWTDRDRGRLIVGLNDFGIEHRFEGDELVIDAGDEERVDDLVATLGATAEETLGEEPDLDADAGDDAGSEEANDEDDDLSAAVKLLADGARRLREDPTDMQADADVAEASAAVFMAERWGPFDEEAWSAIGRVTRRLLAALGADEALEADIQREAGVLEKLLAAATGGESPDPGEIGDPGERTVYDLTGWLPDQRAQIGYLLERAGIDYAWEGDELLIPSSRESEAEELFDLVGGPVEDGDAEADADELRYQAVAELFAATGRLAGDPTDPVRRENVLRWAKETEGAPLFGMDEVVWFRIRTRTRALTNAIEDGADADLIHRESESLHDLLRTVV